MQDGSATSTVASPARSSRRAPETQDQGKRCITSIPPIEWLALLKAAVGLLLHEGFAGNTGPMGCAQLMVVIQLLKLVDSARNMVPMGSALSTPAIQPPGI